MNVKYKLHYTFKTKINEEIIDKSRKYWSSNQFALVHQDNTLNGCRGSWFGNLTSFDMKNLISTIEVKLHEDSDQIEVTMLLNGIFQQITEWNLTDLKLELIMFEVFLCGQEAPSFISRYEKARNKSHLKWALTLSTTGNSLDHEWKTEIDKLMKNTSTLKIEKL